MRLDGQVVLITGASSGIGTAVAGRCRERGARLLVHGRDADRTAAVAEQFGGTALSADLTDARQRSALVDNAVAVHGRIDVLINNAGRGWSGPLDQMPPAVIGELIELDLQAPIELSRAVLPGMIARRHGWICFVSSIAGRSGVAGEAVYSAAKAGVDGFAESLRAEAYGAGVGVSVVVPGAVETAFFTRRGRPYQRSVPRPVPADRVGRAVVDGIESERAERWVPGWLRIAPVVRTLLPGVFRTLSVRFGEQVRLGGSSGQAQTTARYNRDRKSGSSSSSPSRSRNWPNR